MKRTWMREALTSRLKAAATESVSRQLPLPGLPPPAIVTYRGDGGEVRYAGFARLKQADWQGHRPLLVENIARAMTLLDDYDNKTAYLADKWAKHLDLEMGALMEHITAHPLCPAC